MVTPVQRVLLVWVTLLDFIQSYNLFAFDWSFPFQTFRTRIDCSCPAATTVKVEARLFKAGWGHSHSQIIVSCWAVATKRGKVAALNCWVWRALFIKCISLQLSFCLLSVASIKKNYETETLLLNLSDENQKEPLNLIVFALCHLIFPSCNSEDSQLDMGGVGKHGYVLILAGQSQEMASWSWRAEV